MFWIFLFNTNRMDGPRTNLWGTDQMISPRKDLWGTPPILFTTSNLRLLNGYLKIFMKKTSKLCGVISLAVAIHWCDVLNLILYVSVCFSAVASISTLFVTKLRFISYFFPFFKLCLFFCMFKNRQIKYISTAISCDSHV